MQKTSGTLFRVASWSPRFAGKGQAVLAVVVVGILSLVSGCAGEDDASLSFLVETERDGRGAVSEDRITELRRDIRTLEDEVAEQVQRLGRIASYRKLLAQALIDQEMYGPALEELQEALVIQTDNPVLYYMAGVSAGRAAESMALSGRSAEYIALAEQMYRESLRIRPDYRDALYGMAVLLAFEQDLPEEAITYVQRLVQVAPQDHSAQFLLANVLVRLGRLDDAEAAYAALVRSAPTEELRQQAADNRAAVARELGR